MSSHAEPEARPSPEEIRRDIEALPSDWSLCRVGPDKAPIGGKGWYDNDRHTPDEAASLNGAMPPAWGLLCGEASGALVLDLDAPGWRESFEEVTGHPVEDLPPTIAWTSGKPGRSGHAFAVPLEWWPALRNRAFWDRPWRDGERPPGAKSDTTTTWELRWTGHQSVIIGAHPETGRYSWLPGCSPHDIPDPAEAPDWLLELLLIQEHPQAAPVEPTAEDAARAAAMLQCIPAADHSSYHEWLRVGMALHHTDPGLLSAWVDWSRQMATFDEAECLAKWESFGKGQKGRPATIATLHFLAKPHGYREPKRQPDPTEAFTAEEDGAAELQARLAAATQAFDHFAAATLSLEEVKALIEKTPKWKYGTDEAEAVIDDLARAIGGIVGDEGGNDQSPNLIPLRDRLCRRFGAPAAWAKALILSHAKAWIKELDRLHDAKVAAQAEVDAPARAAQQAQQQERLRQELAHLGGMEAVLHAAGNGWGKEGESKLTPGALVGRIRDGLGDRLGFDEMRLLPAVDRQTLPPNLLQLLYVPLSEQGWIISKEQAVDALSRCAFEKSFHPVRLYLEDIEADDSIEPIDLEEFYAFYHVTDPQQQRYMLLMLLAAVWRAMEPGCSLKLCVIFAGPQTTYKSEALRQLCGPEWLVDTRQQQDKDTLLALYASWIYELGEIDALMDRRHAGDLKNLVSPSSDMLRPPFWSAMCRFKRASIFVGTTNKNEFFSDETGNHRYPVVEINEPIDLAGITANRDRIWKTAVALYRQGEKPWLTQEELRASEDRSQQFFRADPWLPIIQQWTDMGISVVTGRTKEGTEITEHRLAPAAFSTTDALIETGVARKDGMPKQHEMRMAAVLKQLGYEKDKNAQWQGGSRVRLWRRQSPQPGVSPEAGADTTSPPGTTSTQPESEQVVSEQTSDQDSLLSHLTQPAQPFTSSGVREEDTHTHPSPVCVSSPLRASRGKEAVSGCAGCASPAPQGVSAAQPESEGCAEVVPEGEVVSPPPPATAFEHPWHALVLAIRQEHPDWIPAQIANHLGADYRHVNGRMVKAFLEKHPPASMAEAAPPPPAGEPLDDPWS